MRINRIDGALVWESDHATMRATVDAASLAGANWVRANLSGANLAGVNLSGANLMRANLSGANLSDAYLAGADLSDAQIANEVVCDALSVGPTLSGYTPVFLICASGSTIVVAGCFSGPLADFKLKVRAHHANNAQALAEYEAVFALVATRESVSGAEKRKSKPATCSTAASITSFPTPRRVDHE